jgi:hypothetical protein
MGKGDVSRPCRGYPGNRQARSVDDGRQRLGLAELADAGRRAGDLYVMGVWTLKTAFGAGFGFSFVCSGIGSTCAAGDVAAAQSLAKLAAVTGAADAPGAGRLVL